MREIIIAEFITLDGVIQAPGGAEEDTEGGFAHGGWTVPYWHDDIGAHFDQAMSPRDLDRSKNELISASLAWISRTSFVFDWFS